MRYNTTPSQYKLLRNENRDFEEHTMSDIMLVISIMLVSELLFLKSSILGVLLSPLTRMVPARIFTGALSPI